MVNYGAAFKLPFSNWKRMSILFFLYFLASLAIQATNLVMYPEGQSLYGDTLPSVTVTSMILVFFFYLVSIVVSLFVQGYGIRISGHAAQGQNVLPPFDNALGMLGRAVQYVLAIIIYVIPFAVLFTLLIAMMALFPNALTIAIGLLVLIPALIFAILFWVYVTPMLTTHFAREKRFSALFEFRKAFKYSFRAAYFVPWLVALAYAIGIGLAYLIVYLPVMFLSFVVPVAGLILAPFSALYSAIITPTMMSLYGQAYHDIVSSKPTATVKSLKHHKR